VSFGRFSVIFEHFTNSNQKKGHSKRECPNRAPRNADQPAHQNAQGYDIGVLLQEIERLRAEIATSQSGAATPGVESARPATPGVETAPPSDTTLQQGPAQDENMDDGGLIDYGDGDDDVWRL
jgi:hypothetical protein